jgi:hypothetical protein
MPGVEGQLPTPDELQELRRRALAKLAEVGHGKSISGFRKIVSLLFLFVFSTVPDLVP